MAGVLFFLLSGCADLNGGIGEQDCFRGLCGCASAHVVNITIRLTHANGSPISDSKLVCHDPSGLLGATDEDGLIHLSVAGTITSACGFFSECQIAYVHKKDGSNGSPFWFTRFVRGEEVHSGDDRIERIDDGWTKSE